jgi:hypothetical protein
MVAPKFRKTTLWVRAIDEAEVREIDENGRPLMALRRVGKDEFGDVMWQGQTVPYHPHYIAKLKEKVLLPMDQDTAILAGVPFNQLKGNNNAF